jgi:hypothetical protein
MNTTRIRLTRPTALIVRVIQGGPRYVEGLSLESVDWLTGNRLATFADDGELRLTAIGADAIRRYAHATKRRIRRYRAAAGLSAPSLIRRRTAFKASAVAA